MISRYYNAPRSWVPHANGDYVEIVLRRPTVYNGQPYATRQARAGDSLSLLAHTHYGDPTAWWRIADMNPKVECPDDLAPGDLVHLPIIST